MNDFVRAGKRLLELIERFRVRLTRRDYVMIKIGMRASHIEEALATGDVARAEAHLERLGKTLDKLADETRK